MSLRFLYQEGCFMDNIKDLEKQTVRRSRLAFVGCVFAAPVVALFSPVLVAMEVENNNLRLPDYTPSNKEIKKEYRKRFVRFFREYVIKLPIRAYNSVYDKGMIKIAGQKNIAKENEQEKFRKIAKWVVESDISDAYVKLLNARNIDVRFFEKTEHQPDTMQKCIFDNYEILFGGTGTEWCGGTHPVTYVSKMDKNGGWTQIATLDDDTSGFIRNAAEWRYKQLKLGQIIGSIKR